MNLTVREMTEDEINLRINYFLEAPPEYLKILGVDPTQLPNSEQWHAESLTELALPIVERSIIFLTWLLDGDPVGFSTADHISFGENAKMHLHILQSKRRKHGMGQVCVRKSACYYFEKLKLKRLYCEPNALNTAPNRTLQKAGFKYLKTYITKPGPINFEQPVTRWLLRKEDLKSEEQHHLAS